ncbi:DMT family transporter [Patescibacteria group bacterium]|nr:DMT family transporter [Patescibacteria group bacterium]
MKKSAIFYLTLASFSYGLFVVLVKYLLNLGLKSLPLVVSTGVFFFIFSILYCLFNFSYLKNISKRNWIKIFILGALATFTGRILMFVGQSFTTAINAGFLLKLTGLTTIPFAYFLLREKIEKKDYIAFLIMLIGTFLLVTGGRFDIPNIGDLLLILLVIIFGFTNTLAKQVMREVSPNSVSSLRLFFGNLLLFGFITPFLGKATFTPLTTNLALVFVGAILGFIYLFTFYRGIKLAGASTATIFFLLSAVFTTVFAYILLGESIGLVKGLGAVLMLIGAFFLAK